MTISDKVSIPAASVMGGCSAARPIPRMMRTFSVTKATIANTTGHVLRGHTIGASGRGGKGFDMREASSGVSIGSESLPPKLLLSPSNGGSGRGLVWVEVHAA